jgi:predicted transcriptional regulator
METKERNTITIHLPQDLKREVKILALQENKTLTQLVVELLRRELKDTTPNRAGHPAQS